MSAPCPHFHRGSQTAPSHLNQPCRSGEGADDLTERPDFHPGSQAGFRLIWIFRSHPSGCRNPIVSLPVSLGLLGPAVGGEGARELWLRSEMSKSVIGFIYLCNTMSNRAKEGAGWD